MFGEGTLDWRASLVVVVLEAAAIIAIVAVWWRWAERRSAASVGLPRRRLARAEGRWLLLGLGWGVATAIILSVAEGELGLVPGALRTLAVDPLAVAAALLVLLPAGVVAAAAEEVVFRGWGLAAVSARAGVGVAVAVTSVLFAFAHFEPGQLQLAGRLISLATYVLAGAGMAVIALKRGDLYGATAFHAGFNVAILLLDSAAPTSTRARSPTRCCSARAERRTSSARRSGSHSSCSC
jgi:membrane protease YdiL (CAAX protease family)